MPRIPRIVIAATQSGSGKTTLVTGILAALRERGLSPQSFKVGPDYIDPGYHQLASGRPGHNLDSWLVPPEVLREIFIRRAASSDLAVVEGVMGLYDGGRRGVSSTAEVAKLLDAPVLLVIDAKSMGASAAALAMGFRDYDPEVRLAGVLLNRLGSPTHEAMIVEALKPLGIPVLGAVRREEGLSLPERHLGLLPIEENREQEVVTRIGKAIGSQVKLDEILRLAGEAPPLETSPKTMKQSFSGRKKVRIALARDEAFSFYYPESLEVFRAYGAEILEFSPLRDPVPPEADGMIFGGGFPEMFAETLSRNDSMRQSIRRSAEEGMPIYGECGGFMYLRERLKDFSGKEFPMVGALPGSAAMTKKLQMVGYVTAQLREDTILGPRGRSFRGHEFHFSLEPETAPSCSRAFTFTRLRNGAVYPAGYVKGNVMGSYLHLHFAGCPEAAGDFVEACRKFRKEG